MAFAVCVKSSLKLLCTLPQLTSLHGRAYAHMNTYIHAHMNTYIHAHMNTYIHAHMNTYIHAHMNTYIRDEFIRYRIAVCDAKSKFCDAKLNVIRRKLRCEAILTAPKKMLFVCDFRAYMSACTRTVFQCSVRSKIVVVRDFLLLVAGPGHPIRATFCVCHTLVVSLIFVCAVLITSCNLRLTE